ncbi:methyl-accepting chemotaxis protein [Marinospirillum insulare]|uniref:Methyl-accepting chemotaxis protein n=1 Tax=Marinospirillum insulare TaxID=217169 RepID=A0ABQ5ZXB7_9GAMM|nr:methyl-accepting chemotaxis protein [Marinospirillum insulare]GLR63286.1 methyl-accepting chemotaxis protein [Marinospirillum insulare]
MFNKLSIGLRIQLGFALVLVLGIGILLPLQLNNMDKLMLRTEQDALNRLHQAALDEINNQQSQALHLAAAIASQPDVQRNFAAQNRAVLEDELLPVFENLQQMAGIEQMQFHLPPATSFLRLHKPAKYGDDLSSFRHTVVETNRNKNSVSGIESGVAGIGIRGVVPVTWQGRHYGSLEFGLSLRQAYADAFKASQKADMVIYQATDKGFEQLVSTWQGQELIPVKDFNQVMQGKTLSTRTAQDGHDIAVLAAPLKDYSGNTIGVMAIYADRSASVAAFKSAIATTSTVSLLILLAGLLVSWLLARRGIISPIKRLNLALQNISEGDQDLRQRLPIEGKNELSEVAKSFNRFVAKVEATVLSVLDHVGELGEKAEYTFRVTGETADSMKRQQMSTEEVSTAMNEMSVTAVEIASHAAETANATEQADQSSAHGNEVVHQTSEGISRLAAEVDQAAQVIRKLNEYSENIGSILDVISGISEQTNLLALNAAIEAARAGEHGRGFAVVADEVRQLAQRSQEATGQIHGMIEQLQQGVEESVNVIERSHKEAEKTVEQTEAARLALQEITEAMRRISDMSAQIASAAEEQTAVSDDINRHIVIISEGAVETVGQTSNIIAATSGIGSEISELMKQMRGFKVNIEPHVELALAKSAHRAWKVRVRSFLDGQSSLSLDQAVSHTQCDLGVWYLGEGMKSFGHFPEMKALDEPHAELHKLIQEIIKAKQQGNDTHAEDLYLKVDDYSDQIVALLNEVLAKIGRA